MTEAYPDTPPQKEFVPTYGSGTLLPHPGSARIVEEDKVLEYEKYAGVQLHPHEFMARAVAKVATSGVAIIDAETKGIVTDDTVTTEEVKLKLVGDVVSFNPPAPAELARTLGSLVNKKMHLLDIEARAKAASKAAKKAQRALAIAS